jgi:AcrR family transcriptional regulator
MGQNSATGESIPVVADTPCRPLRADARQNRERLTRSAREVFAEQGLEASIAEITRRAGVGAGTLYRHFPDREALITSVFVEKMDTYVALARSALEDPDPWRGFRTYVEQVCAMQAEDRGFTAVLTNRFPKTPEFEARREAAYVHFARLADRSQAGGRLRPDFTHEDMLLLVMANAGVVAATSDTAPEAWRRHVGYMLQALDARNTDPLPDPPSPEGMVAALERLDPGSC